MDPDLLSLLALAGIAAFAALAGGLIPAFVATSDRARGHLLHVAAGVLLAVVSVELWPEIYRMDRAWAMVGGLLAGAGAMIALNLVTQRLERGEEGRSATGLIAAAGIDSTVDGLLIGIGYAADSDLGILLAIGIAIEKFTMTMTVGAELRKEGRSRQAIAVHAAIIAGLLVPAAAAGMILLADPTSRAHTFLLSAAAAALLYIVTMELVARGREAHDTPATIAFFFAGFIGLAAYTVFAPG